MIPHGATIVLDAGPLGILTNPTTTGEPARIRRWLADLSDAGHPFVLPEIGDYECRRKLLHLDSHNGVAFLDWLKYQLDFVPIDSGIMLRAAEIWSWDRKRGVVRSSPDPIDADAILTATLELLERPDIILATTNKRDFPGFDARVWSDITLE